MANGDGVWPDSLLDKAKARQRTNRIAYALRMDRGRYLTSAEIRAVYGQNARLRSLFHRMGLPTNLVTLIRLDMLADAIDVANRWYDEACARADAFDEAHPKQAKKLPWYKDRQKWKKAGRPRPEWYELLAYARHCRQLFSFNTFGAGWEKK